MKASNHRFIPILLLLLLIAGPALAAQKALNWYKYEGDGPGKRSSPLMAYDSDRDVVVLYGGFNGKILTDTWEWNGYEWKQIKITGAGQHRNGAMAYDALRKQIVLFSGTTSGINTRNGTTWLYDGTEWTQVNPAMSPDGRDQYVMVYDSKRQKILAYAGEWNTHNIELTDLWQWNGTNWSQIGIYDPFPEGHLRYGPEYRKRHAGAFDSRRGVMVIHGGSRKLGGDATEAASDTWEWNGNTWSLKNQDGFGVREWHQMVYADAQRRCILFGGNKRSDGSLPTDTWVWYGNTWKKLVTADAPVGRYLHGMAYDSTRNEVVLMGGYFQDDSSGSYKINYSDETWVLRYKHDFLIKSVKTSPASFAFDEEITLSAKVRNKGKGWSGKHKVTFYLSVDNTLDDGDVMIFSMFSDPLGKGNKYKVAAGATPGGVTGVQRGTYYLIATVYDEIPGFDANPNNNVSVSKQTVTIQ